MSLTPEIGDKKLAKALISALTKKHEEDGGKHFNEMLYAEKLLRRLCPIRVKEGDWWAYRDGFWQVSRAPYATAPFLPYALAILSKRYRTARNTERLLAYIAAKNQFAGSMVGLCKLVEEADHTKSILINVANGVVKIWEGGVVTLEKHDKEHGFTSKTEASYVEGAECPLFKATQAEALPDPDDRTLFQTWCGSIFWPTAEFETAMIAYGKAGTGKSVLAGAVAGVLRDPEKGGSAVTAVSMHELCSSKTYSLPSLQLASLNLGTELDSVDLDESSKFKLIVSGEEIEARRIYGAPYVMRTTCKFLFLSNHVPRFENGSGAEARRLRFLRFEIVPKNIDTELSIKLAGERDGILAWMLEGLLRLQRDKFIPTGGTGSVVTALSFAASNDCVGFFIDERCCIQPDAVMLKADLLAAFNDWRESRGLPEQEQRFWRVLADRYNSVTSIRLQRGGDRAWYVRGIRLKEELA